jgi:hypothetical protein
MPILAVCGHLDTIDNANLEAVTYQGEFSILENLLYNWVCRLGHNIKIVGQSIQDIPHSTACEVDPKAFFDIVSYEICLVTNNRPTYE